MPTPHRHLSMDQLSHRASTGLAIRRGDIKISDPIPSSYKHNGVEMDGTHDQHALDTDDSVPYQERSIPLPFHGRSGSAPLSSNPAHISKFTERTSLDPTLSINNMTSSPFNEPVTQRRDTGLRASLKRMFSKKNHSALGRRGAHHSDPGSLVTMPTQLDRAHYHSPSVQHVATTPGHPLNSHAISPHLRTQMIDNSSQVSDLGHLEKRRNTLPDLSLDPVVDAEGTRQEQQQQQQQHEEQTNHLQVESVLARPGTSTLQITPSVQFLNRRSKSAGALTDLVSSPKLPSSKPKSQHRRDRSEEITYWRSSVVNHPLPQMSSIESISSINVLRGQRQAENPSPKQPRPSIEPAQDFDFGLDNGSNLVKSTNLAQRVNTLEVKLYDFEYALAKLQGNDIAKPALPKKPSRRRSTRSAIPESGDSSSSTNDTSYLSSQDEKWASPLPRQQSHFRQDRTSKAATIKPLHARRPSNRSQVSSPSIHITHSQYDSLRTLIEDEKNARRQLEMQMANLQQQVETLKTPVHAYIRPVQYPTPSPESIHTSNRTPALHALRRSPAMQPVKDSNETSRFSMSETEPETEVDTDHRNNGYRRSPEMFETPQESHFRFDLRTTDPPGMF